MNRKALILGWLVLSLPLLHASDVLDHIAVAVNAHAILQSDWQDEMRYECFASGRKLDDVTPPERKAALDRLIDQELLREQISSSVKPASTEEVGKQFEAMKNEYTQAHQVQSWSAALASYRLTEEDVRNHIALELTQLRLVDAHLRPSIQVDSAEVAAYYKDHLATQGSGGPQMSLQEAAPRIRELLTQQRMDQLLSSWLESLRTQSQIRMFVADPSFVQGPGQ